MVIEQFAGYCLLVSKDTSGMHSERARSRYRAMHLRLQCWFTPTSACVISDLRRKADHLDAVVGGLVWPVCSSVAEDIEIYREMIELLERDEKALKQDTSAALSLFFETLQTWGLRSLVISKYGYS